jgi:Domain of unknown function DUF11
MKFCRLSTKLLPTLLAVLAVGGLLFGAQPASAQGTCIQDVWKAHGNNQNLTCSAKDVNLSSATNIQIQTGGQCVIENNVRVCRCFAGQNVTFTADFQMDLTADTRYDVGFYLATDGDTSKTGALTGQCSATASLASNTPAGNFVNLDAAPDVCGDITGPAGTDHNPLFVTAQTTAVCPSTPGQQLKVPFCTTWRQPGSNEQCAGTGNGTTTNDVFPGSPSKCNCDILAIDIFAETPDITVAKSAAPTQVLETGGDVTYTVTVTNNGQLAVTLASLVDNQYGNITANHAAGANCNAQGGAGTCLAVSGTTCVPDGVATTCEIGAGGSIAGGGSCSCTFTGHVPPGDTGGSFTDTVTACASNITTPTPICRTAPATVTYTDVPQPPTLTKTAAGTACRIDQTYNVVVTNTSAQDELTLNTLNDDVYGDITTAAGSSCTGTCIVSTTCGQASGAGTLPAQIAVSSNYSCSFVGRFSQCNTTIHDTVTATATDDDGTSYTPSDDATVVITVTKP